MLMLPAPPMYSARIPFGGFYESMWSGLVDREAESWLDYVPECRNSKYGEQDRYSEEEYYADAEGKLGEFLFEATDYSAAYRDIARDYAEAFLHWLAESVGLGGYGTTLQGEYEEMTSPRYYNFETDRIFCLIPRYILQAVRDQLGEAALSTEFASMFTSRDGFISFYDNEVPDKPLEEWDHNELYCLLTAWCEHQLGGHQDINWELFDYGDFGSNAYQYFDDAVDWDKLKNLCLEFMADHMEANGIRPDDLPYRCPLTMELPL